MAGDDGRTRLGDRAVEATRAVAKSRPVGRTRLGLGPVELILKVVAKRRQLRAYFVCNVQSALMAYRTGILRLPLTLLVFVEELLMMNLYMRVVRWRSPEQFVIHEVEGTQLVLDLHDEGLSRDLYIYGVREAETTRVFQAELRRLRHEVDSPVVLEIGANVGYFATMEARLLGESARIHAIEPNPTNVTLLQQAVALNDYQDVITVSQGAIGDHDGTDVLDISNNSNLSRIHGAPKPDQHDIVDSLEVPMWTVAGFLADHDLPVDGVNVIRLDVEGYEVQIFRELDAVLDSSGPLLLFMELHRNFLTPAELAELTAQLERYDFRIVSAIGSGGVGWSGLGREMTTWDEIRTQRSVGPVRLIAKRDGGAR
ncbi:FkbM family methyltransferase [Haladaptatus sp. DYSN1]|uniref:FkbM family methyltransferase n=1 Tax=unclassified Haladaptatus TaxID=2622732 RepID=UPI002406C89E|nr:FkbM family methyltransferase [Haladaptatus sp. DYSN1]